MLNVKMIFYCGLMLCLTCCRDNDKDPVQIPTTLPSSVQYDLTINFIWSESNHTATLGSFPSGPHFSSVIGLVHKQDVTIFTVGEIASDGIKSMAETGATSTLSVEINQLISAGSGGVIIKGSGAASPGRVVINSIDVNDTFHYLTFVSMIAPSPDWFTAARNVNLKNSDGTWMESLTFDIFGYDAGTDSGLTFTAANSTTDPRDKITQFEGDDRIVFAKVTLTLKK